MLISGRKRGFRVLSTAGALRPNTWIKFQCVWPEAATSAISTAAPARPAVSFETGLTWTTSADAALQTGSPDNGGTSLQVFKRRSAEVAVSKVAIAPCQWRADSGDIGTIDNIRVFRTPR
jgi:hypothetical protein